MANFIARFSNAHVITAKDPRLTYTHAWHAMGRHAINNEPWSSMASRRQPSERTREWLARRISQGESS
jgi:hypothetical protein